MFPPFDEEEAYKICNFLIENLDSKTAQIEKLGKQSEERKDDGVMIGGAIILLPDGSLSALTTVSGNARTITFSPTFWEKWSSFSKIPLSVAPPVATFEEINKALSKNDAEIHSLTESINLLKNSRRLTNGKYSDITEEERTLVQKRMRLTTESLNSVFKLYNFWCADGKRKNLLEMTGASLHPTSASLSHTSTAFSYTNAALPPTGTGDCAAPKLLNEAFSKNAKVLSMCEVYYGKENTRRIKGEKYPPCDERCALILPEMLGLKILYRDKSIVVVDKQPDLLSVPGRGPEKQDCIVNRLKRLFPSCIEQPSVHRLDMETSGIMVLALTREAHKNLNRQFEERLTYKEYEALLDGEVESKEGILELYFRVDLDNRPHQIWDEVYGKKAVTEYKNLGIETYISPEGEKLKATRMHFIPHTGRTHQLRLASADSHGLNVPIIGDTLYGSPRKGERLMLHAKTLLFTHPETGEKMEFHSKVPF